MLNSVWLKSGWSARKFVAIAPPSKPMNRTAPNTLVGRYA